ncbi:hypothetical protein HHL17_22265 [Chitinophaga sp. G-6-1-13]|uniref:Uncharacterized protein n=1 Tax=Chitinophaga fulva TaxID=2728842 RepID=A0A848GS58_9BACT|nr:hypothetical protein [Chitinophaga fulva]NML39942.1 hypothetical protein [Chitinophaga fulva]
MYRISLLIPMFVLLCTGYTYAQASASKRIRIYDDTAAIKTGRYLEYAKTFSVKEFVEYYVKEGKVSASKKWGDLYIVPLYKDLSFTFWGRIVPFGHLLHFFKVSNKELEGVDYESLDRDVLKSRFIAEIVPAADKTILGKKGLRNCRTDYEAFDFIYHPEKKQLEMVYHWTIDCSYRLKKLRKHYTSQYDLASKQFVK